MSILRESLVAALGELASARVKFSAPFNSAHEGFAVLLEEVEELKAEVFHGGPDRVARMRAEALQVAAMALRFVEDLCEPPKAPPVVTPRNFVHDVHFFDAQPGPYSEAS